MKVVLCLEVINLMGKEVILLNKEKEVSFPIEEGKKPVEECVVDIPLATLFGNNKIFHRKRNHLLHLPKERKGLAYIVPSFVEKYLQASREDLFTPCDIQYLDDMVIKCKALCAVGRG